MAVRDTKQICFRDTISSFALDFTEQVQLQKEVVFSARQCITVYHCTDLSKRDYFPNEGR